MSDRGTDLVGGQDTVGVGLRIAELLEGDVIRVERFQSVVDDLLDLRGSLVRRVVVTVLRHDAHLVLVAVLLHLEAHGRSVGVGELRESLLHILTNLFSRNGLVETDHVSAAARELGSEVQSADGERNARQNHQGNGDAVSQFALGDEVDARVIEEVLRPAAREGDVTPFADDPLDHQARDEDGAEDRGDDTDDERRSEALHGTRTEDEEDDTRDDGGQLTVDDGRVGLRETVLDGQRNALAAAELLLDAFVDDDVGIDGHTHRQHDTGDTRKGQHGAERHEHAHQQEDVGQQRDVGHPARRLIEEAHVEEYEDEGDHERKHTGVDRLLAQRRTDDRILNDLRGSGTLPELSTLARSLAS